MIDLLLEPEIFWAIVGGVLGGTVASQWPRYRWLAFIVYVLLGVVAGFVLGAIIDTQGVSTILVEPS